MDMTLSNNYVRLCGVMGRAPEYSHTSRGQDFFTFPLEVLRLSGNCDRVNVILRRELLESTEAAESERILVTGQLRTFNNRHGEGARLVISVFAKELCLCDEPDSNLVELCGTLCKSPNLRCTPMGRDICDLMLAVNRHYGRSDYLPCICWGVKAREAALWDVGMKIRLRGRIQSRQYIKLSEEGAVEKTAFEVSVTEAEPAEEAEEAKI